MTRLWRHLAAAATVGLGLVLAGGAVALAEEAPSTQAAASPASADAAAATRPASPRAASPENITSAAQPALAAVLPPDDEIAVGAKRAAEAAGASGSETQAPAAVVRRGFLGVELTELTPELRVHFGSPADAGVMVARVIAGSPADHAGLAVGDILVAVDGVAIASSWDVRARVRPLEEGALLAMEVRREGQAQIITAAVEQRERRPDGTIDPGPEPAAPPASAGSPLAPAAASGTDSAAARAARQRLEQQQKTPREVQLEKELKALIKRLDDLENRLPKPPQ